MREFRVTVTLTTNVVFSEGEPTGEDVIDAFLGYGLGELLDQGEYSTVGAPKVEPI